MGTMYCGISAEYYDLLYAQVIDYPGQAEELRQLITTHGLSTGYHLDVACGTGRHLELLSRPGWNMFGLDESPDMVGITRTRAPAENVYPGNMLTFQLKQRFEVVSCLFGAIGHMTETADLHRAIANMAAHLEPGGLLIIESWLLLGQSTHELGRDLTARTDNLVITRLSHNWEHNDRLVQVNLGYLLVRKGSVAVGHYTENFTLARYSTEEYQVAIAAAGLHAEYLPPSGDSPVFPRGIFIGRADAY